jgi:hypothetical protein
MMPIDPFPTTKMSEIAARLAWEEKRPFLLALRERNSEQVRSSKMEKIQLC